MSDHMDWYMRWAGYRAHAMMQPVEQEAAEITGRVLRLWREVDEEYGTVKCQSAHAEIGAETCSLEVVAIKTHCEGSFFACSNSAAWNRACIASNTTLCSMCMAPVRDCWEIRVV